MSPKEREGAAGVLDFQIRSGSKILGFDKEPQETNRRCIFSLICEIFPFVFVLFCVLVFHHRQFCSCLRKLRHKTFRTLTLKLELSEGSKFSRQPTGLKVLF